GVAHAHRAQLDPKRRRGPLDRAELAGPSSNGAISKYPHPRHARRDLFEQLQPFHADGVFKRTKSSNVAARARQTLDETGADRIGNVGEHDRHGAGRLEQRTRAHAAAGEYDVRRERDQLCRVFASIVYFAQRHAVVDPQVIAVVPSQFLQCLQERRYAPALFRIVFSQVRKHADASHALGLPSVRDQRPRGRRAAEQRDEIAAPHSITSSASASSVGGTSMPSALAVLRLITNSYLVSACTGRSVGFSPLEPPWAAQFSASRTNLGFTR